MTRNRFLLFFVSFAILVSMLGTSALGSVSTVSVDENGSVALTILHTNDVHGRYSADSGAEIPHSVIAGYYESLKQPALLLSAGDMTQGVYYVNESKGLSAIDIMNAANYDAMALGNHEFDYGWDNTLALQKAANFPFLSQISEFPDYTVISRGGIRVGIFGLTTPYTRYSSSGGLGKDFGLRDELVEHAQKMVAQLRMDENVDIVVCLAHLGISEDGASGKYYGTSYDIRDEVSGIDVIIDGHSHTALADIKQEDGKALIVQTGAEGKSLGEVDFYLKDGKYIPVGRSLGIDDFEGVTPDVSVAAVADKWQAAVDQAGGAVVSKLDKDILVDRQFERTQETIMGDLITDAFVAASGADIAFENGGGIRASLNAGDITVADINNVLPFTSFIVMAEVKGGVIRDALEHSVSVYPEQLGGFLQTSGLSFGFDPDLEANHRVVYVTVNGRPLDDDKTYKVATNDFTAAGGDDFSMFKEPFKNALPIKEQGLSALADILTWYLNDHKDDISFETQGRVNIVRTTAQPAPNIAVDPVVKTGITAVIPHGYRIAQ
ncbi:metallophosphatase [Clostridia bacterium]|nr:metallophosphatase [Clostridia bacterium]